MLRDYKGRAGAKQGPELPIGCALSRCEMEIDPLVIRVLLFSSSAMCVNAWGEKNVNNVSMEIAAAAPILFQGSAPAMKSGRELRRIL